MRIIEPKNVGHRKRAKKRSKTIPFLLFLLLFAAMGTTYGGYKKGYTAFASKKKPVNSELKGVQVEVPHDEYVPPVKTKLRQFSNEEFRKLYDAFVYPNMQEVTDPPSITGNLVADERIRKLAITRGYKLRSIPVEPIRKVEGIGLGEDDLLQTKAIDSWLQLQAAAKKAGLPLQISSAYRSVEFQRNLFMTRVTVRNVTVEKIAAGSADAQIIEELRTTAIPGYSRHHTGYTVDFVCNGIGLGGFIDTACYKWLADNNYENAKKAGWIPSYPPNTGIQGPEPEPWEFVWVGTDAVME
jgi:D-alanyl-D-alanine carboxypeptidase